MIISTNIVKFLNSENKMNTAFPLLNAAAFIKFQTFWVRRILEEAFIRGRRLYLCQRFINYLKGVRKKNKKQLIFRSFC